MSNFARFPHLYANRPNPNPHPGFTHAIIVIDEEDEPITRLNDESELGAWLEDNGYSIVAFNEDDYESEAIVAKDTCPMSRLQQS